MYTEGDLEKLVSETEATADKLKVEEEELDEVFKTISETENLACLRHVEKTPVLPWRQSLMLNLVPAIRDVMRQKMFWSSSMVARMVHYLVPGTSCQAMLIT